jgi:predicted phage terminase large subunit-like protein
VATSSPTSSAKRSAKRSAASLTAAAAEASRHYLDAYGAWTFGLQPAPHHQVWLEAIDAMLSGRSGRRRLLLIAPPGHGKTTWISHVLPSWLLGRSPERSVLFLTSSDVNARHYGSVVKSTLEGNPRHELAFPAAGARPDVARGWSTDGLFLQATPGKDPAYRSVGFGSSVIGARADVLILDDPLTQEQSQSEVEQLRAARYLDATLLTRLNPGGIVIMVSTRWAEGDLPGHVLPRPEWQVIHQPALDDVGEALWPARFPTAALRAIEREIGGPMFAAVYQGNPTALGGLIFESAAWFKSWPDDLDPDHMTTIMFWDLAFSERQTSDYTAALTLIVEHEPRYDLNRFVVWNVFRERIREEELLEEMVNHILVMKPKIVAVEEGAYRQSATRDLIHRLDQDLQRLHIATVVQGVKVDRDKVTRARLPAARAQAGQVHADTEAAWWPGFLAELVAFPYGRHDDQVDALSGAMQVALESVLTRGPTTTQRTHYGYRPSRVQRAHSTAFSSRGP